MTESQQNDPPLRPPAPDRATAGSPNGGDQSLTIRDEAQSPPAPPQPAVPVSSEPIARQVNPVDSAAPASEQHPIGDGAKTESAQQTAPELPAETSNDSEWVKPPAADP